MSVASCCLLCSNNVYDGKIFEFLFEVKLTVRMLCSKQYKYIQPGWTRSNIFHLSLSTITAWLWCFTASDNAQTSGSKMHSIDFFSCAKLLSWSWDTFDNLLSVWYFWSMAVADPEEEGLFSTSVSWVGI